MLILQLRLFFIDCFFFFFFFSLSHFSIFFNAKDGRTPLFFAAQQGHEQIVQILLEKGSPNIDVILFDCFFFFFFLFLFFFFSLSYFFTFFFFM